jgi:hypothetical protein
MAIRLAESSGLEIGMPNPNDPNDNSNYKERKLPKPIEEVRADLSADPDVREQAKMLDIPLADYVQKIIDYATHPDKPPQVWVLKDEELKKRNPGIPTLDEVEGYLKKVVAGEVILDPAHPPDGFSTDKTRERYAPALGTAEAPKGSPETKSADPKKP